MSASYLFRDMEEFDCDDEARLSVLGSGTNRVLGLMSEARWCGQWRWPRLGIADEVLRTRRTVVLSCALVEIKRSIEDKTEQLANLEFKELSDSAESGDSQHVELPTRC